MVAATARVALYNTLSPIDSDPERAFRELRAFAAARDFRVAAEFVDRGFPDSHRPQRAHLIEMILEGKLDLVAVWRLERFGRSLHDIMASIDPIVHAGV